MFRHPDFKLLQHMKAQIKRIQKDIEIINSFNATPEKGITRLTFSKEYQAAVAYVVDELRHIGVQMSYCQAGNIRARLPGSEDNAPAVMMGSHLDTVIHGGRFDGVAGVVTAEEAAIENYKRIPYNRGRKI